MPVVPLQSMQQYRCRNGRLEWTFWLWNRSVTPDCGYRRPLSDGSSTTQVYTINVLDFNEFAITQVTDSDANTNEVSEAALAGAVVGLTAFAEDLDLSP